MIKIGLRHPSGLEIEFEGDKDDFAAFAAFLARDLGAFVGALTPANPGDAPPLALDHPGAPVGTEQEDDDESDAGGPLGAGGAIDARAVSTRISALGAATDIERVTIIAQAAVEAGMEGIDYATIPRIYDDMGIPKPTRFAKTFSNAKTRGLVKSVKYGVWAPTVQGENYARYGHKPVRRIVRKLTDGRRASNGSPELLEPGGDPSAE